MDVQLKQRLVGLTVIFSLAVIFLPMLLDGAGIARDEMPEQTFPAQPEVKRGVKIEELVIELDKNTKKLTRLEPVVVDEVSQRVQADSDSKKQLVEAKAPTEPQVSTPSPKPPVVAKQPEAVATKLQSEAADKTAPDKTPVKAAAPVVAAVKTPIEKSNSEPEPELEKDQPATPETRPGGELWVVQIGSFQESEKAELQRDRVKKSKVGRVFIEKHKKNGQLLYRVRLGPYLTRDKANVARNKLRAKSNVKSILMKYEK